MKPFVLGPDGVGLMFFKEVYFDKFIIVIYHENYIHW